VPKGIPLNGYAPHKNGTIHMKAPPVGPGHNSGVSGTVFEQFEAIVDSADFTAEQKCILVKIRCRVNAKTMDNAIASNEGLMRAASLKDPRALRAELRELQGKARAVPKDKSTDDPIDKDRATIVIEERPGKASVIAFKPERLHAIVAAYLQLREQKRGPGRPPASHVGGLDGKPPASDAPPFSGKPPASGTGGLEKPPASHAENPLRQTHPDPIPISGREDRGGADALDLLGADASEQARASHKRERKAPKPHASGQEVEDALAAYNKAAEMHGFTFCRTLTDTRRKRLGTRLHEIGGVPVFQRALSAIPRNDFLMGKVRSRNGGAPFKLDIDRLFSTESGMGDVLAKLIDAAGDTPADASVEAEVQQIANSETGRLVIGHKGREAAMREFKENVLKRRGAANG
jgi:hypothetical protein